MQPKRMGSRRPLERVAVETCFQAERERNANSTLEPKSSKLFLLIFEAKLGLGSGIAAAAAEEASFVVVASKSVSWN